MVALDEKLVLAKCRVDSLNSVRNLNLWGSDLDDMSILQLMPNVEVLSLSMNNIASLREFSSCTKLTELYLRKNKISDMREVRYLANCPHLKVLWLSENPCAEHPNYRSHVIATLPQLLKLDSTDVTSEEKISAAVESVNLSSEEQRRRDEVSKRPHSGRKISSDPTSEQREAGRRMWQPQNPAQISEAIRQAGDRHFTPEEKAGTFAPIAPVAPVSRRQKAPSESNLPTPSLSRKESSLLAAITLLLNELDDASLASLRKEVDTRITRAGC
eukprot:TRINITY_DN5078_c0_g1_i3.p1 TRINITY_DN5078_c0_g1~~TRINITY_DN5078_c0_g1_i3.p1  ORF type:complete len:272 (-),score=59.32 TRINITY_DN5078_c0_g1_i3:98-913(-)